MISNATIRLMELLKEVEGIEYVDMFYSQDVDENASKILKLPAILFNLVGPEYTLRTNSTDTRIVKYGALLFVQDVKGNMEQELASQDLTDRVYKKLRTTPDFRLKYGNCIERKSNITCYYMEIEHISVA